MRRKTNGRSAYARNRVRATLLCKVLLAVRPAVLIDRKPPRRRIVRPLVNPELSNGRLVANRAFCRLVVRHCHFSPCGSSRSLSFT